MALYFFGFTMPVTRTDSVGTIKLTANLDEREQLRTSLLLCSIPGLLEHGSHTECLLMRNIRGSGTETACEIAPRRGS